MYSWWGPCPSRTFAYRNARAIPFLGVRCHHLGSQPPLLAAFCDPLCSAANRSFWRPAGKGDTLPVLDPSPRLRAAFGDCLRFQLTLRFHPALATAQADVDRLRATEAALETSKREIVRLRAELGRLRPTPSPDTSNRGLGLLIAGGLVVMAIAAGAWFSLSAKAPPPPPQVTSVAIPPPRFPSLNRRLRPRPFR